MYPDDMKLPEYDVLVLVAVTIAPDGSVVSTSIDKTSGDVRVDAAALYAARSSEYAPMMIGCKAVLGHTVLPIIFRAGDSGAQELPPSPSPTPPSDCAMPFASVRVVNPVQPDESFRRYGKVTVVVVATVGATGSVQDVTITQSSGIREVDEAALRAARQTMYAPRLVDCQAVQGTMRIRFALTPQPSPSP
jgi:TonB family protein